MWLECVEVDFDYLIVVRRWICEHFIISTQVLCHAVRKCCDICTIRREQVALHRRIIREHRCCCTDFRTHVTDGALACCRERCSAVAEVLNDSACSTLHCEDACKLQDHVLRACPAVHLACELHTDKLRHLKFPWHASHHVNRISTTNADRDHAHTTSIWCVRVCADHHAAWECVVLKHHLVNDTCAWLPEADAVLLRYARQEVEHFLVFREGCLKVARCTVLSADQVVAVYR